MIGKGFNLFTTSPELLKYRLSYCCDVCTTPLPVLCLLLCRYRIATVGEYLDEVLEKDGECK